MSLSISWPVLLILTFSHYFAVNGTVVMSMACLKDSDCVKYPVRCCFAVRTEEPPPSTPNPTPSATVGRKRVALVPESLTDPLISPHKKREDMGSSSCSILPFRGYGCEQDWGCDTCDPCIDVLSSGSQCAFHALDPNAPCFHITNESPETCLTNYCALFDDSSCPTNACVLTSGHHCLHSTCMALPPSSCTNYFGCTVGENIGREQWCEDRCHYFPSEQACGYASSCTYLSGSQSCVSTCASLTSAVSCDGAVCAWNASLSMCLPSEPSAYSDACTPLDGNNCTLASSACFSVNNICYTDYCALSYAQSANSVCNSQKCRLALASGSDSRCVPQTCTALSLADCDAFGGCSRFNDSNGREVCRDTCAMFDESECGDYSMCAYDSGVEACTSVCFAYTTSIGCDSATNCTWSTSHGLCIPTDVYLTTTSSPTLSPVPPLPSVAPTSEPTSPTVAPTLLPSDSPTKSPTQAPSYSPTGSPTSLPTLSPTDAPTNAPTRAPSEAPTNAPTLSPTEAPSAPTVAPTEPPTLLPTAGPTDSPSRSPTGQPTVPPGAPSSSPTKRPSKAPTRSPTTSPSRTPTQSPTSPPSSLPTRSPTSSPLATSHPTSEPTSSPTSPPDTGEASSTDGGLVETGQSTPVQPSSSSSAPMSVTGSSSTDSTSSVSATTSESAAFQVSGDMGGASPALVGAVATTCFIICILFVLILFVLWRRRRPARGSSREQTSSAPADASNAVPLVDTSRATRRGSKRLSTRAFALSPRLHSPRANMSPRAKSPRAKSPRTPGRSKGRRSGRSSKRSSLMINATPVTFSPAAAIYNVTPAKSSTIASSSGTSTGASTYYSKEQGKELKRLANLASSLALDDVDSDVSSSTPSVPSYDVAPKQNRQEELKRLANLASSLALNAESDAGASSSNVPSYDVAPIQHRHDYSAVNVSSSPTPTSAPDTSEPIERSR